MALRLLFPIALLGALLAAGEARAQLFRAYVASDGSDANPCTLQLPCRLLPAAISAAASGGEVWMLDSANFNASTVVIGKSISILAIPGAVGSLVSVNSGAAVRVGAAGLKVALRNVMIGPVAGATPGTNGVEVLAASHVSLEDCSISNLPSVGVYATGGSTLKVTDCTVSNIGTWAIWIEDGPRAIVASTRLLDNYGGVLARAVTSSTQSEATLDGVAIAGGVIGVWAYSDASGGIARISVTRSTFDGVEYALESETAGTGFIADVNFGGSLVVESYYAWHQTGAGSSIRSLMDNQVTGYVAVVGNKTPLVAE